MWLTKLVAGPMVATFPVPCLPQSSCSNPPVLCTLIPVTVVTLISVTVVTLIPVQAQQAQAVPMASAPTTPAPTTLSLDDENAIQHFKQCHENKKLRTKRKDVESWAKQIAVKKVAVKKAATVVVQRKCKKCSLPSLEGNYGFCGTHRAKGYTFFTLSLVFSSSLCFLNMQHAC